MASFREKSNPYRVIQAYYIPNIDKWLVPATDDDSIGYLWESVDLLNQFDRVEEEERK